MTRRRWIADEFQGNSAALTGAHAHHLVHVLRARVGQACDISAGGVVRRGTIRSLSESRVEFELSETLPNIELPALTLFLAIFKFDRMEWAIEKCTELGVARIVPLITKRTDNHLASAAPKRRERWERLTRQGAEQSRRIAPPELGDPIEVREAVQAEQRVRVLLAENEQDLRLTDALTEAPTDSTFALAVGPEGGWTEDEVQAFLSAGWLAASMGPTILRAETAAIASVVIALSALS